MSAYETKGRPIPGAAGTAIMALDEATAKLTEEARSDLWNDQAWRDATAAEITEQIWWGFQHENLLPLLTTVETADEGDRIVVEDVYGTEVHWVGLGGQIDETTMTQDVFELRPDYVGFHVSQSEREMRQNFGVKSQQLVQSCVQQIDAAISHRLFRTFQIAIPGPGHASFIQGAGIGSGGGAITLAMIDTAIDEVEDESIDEGGATIVGRRRMVAAVMDAVRDSNLFAPEQNDAIARTGRLGTYRGVPVVQLKNFRDRNKRAYFPRNELLVAAKDASKVGLWGTLATKEGSEQFGWRWHFMGRRSAGFVVHRPESARRIVDTSVTP